MVLGPLLGKLPPDFHCERRRMIDPDRLDQLLILPSISSNEGWRTKYLESMGPLSRIHTVIPLGPATEIRVQSKDANNTLGENMIRSEGNQSCCKPPATERTG